ncbi:hypothetical protein [Larsenimonas suaedae]|uniref:Uncharacterized protein n=1 Tax=Larsenimonas suaedae TaxID=1851019 RepID=A0ABU1GTA3_9GAMM|nr:hypothetical protein [Larsenimonas suaedae]MCM2972403.1 hypothetical protein [Larsenimonas suaedae]MDR5894801.1 hypothetical protein [Larsenimonas suaedae]
MIPERTPVDHPWRRMPNHAITSHISDTSLSAQTRYGAGTLAGAGANAYQR